MKQVVPEEIKPARLDARTAFAQSQVGWGVGAIVIVQCNSKCCVINSPMRGKEHVAQHAAAVSFQITVQTTVLQSACNNCQESLIAVQVC